MKKNIKINSENKNNNIYLNIKLVLYIVLNLN